MKKSAECVYAHVSSCVGSYGGSGLFGVEGRRRVRREKQRMKKSVEYARLQQGAPLPATRESRGAHSSGPVRVRVSFHNKLLLREGPF